MVVVALPGEVRKVNGFRVSTGCPGMVTTQTRRKWLPGKMVTVKNIRIYQVTGTIAVFVHTRGILAFILLPMQCRK